MNFPGSQENTECFQYNNNTLKIKTCYKLYFNLYKGNSYITRNDKRKHCNREKENKTTLDFDFSTGMRKKTLIKQESQFSEMNLLSDDVGIILNTSFISFDH